MVKPYNQTFPSSPFWPSPGSSICDCTLSSAASIAAFKTGLLHFAGLDCGVGDGVEGGVGDGVEGGVGDGVEGGVGGASNCSELK
jgi:hypothetical protein